MNWPSFTEVMSRRDEVMRRALDINYPDLELGRIVFDYEKLMSICKYDIHEIMEIQRSFKVSNTPLYELPNLTRLVRRISEPGKGARIFIKDEACNASGSFKDRRASVTAHEAKKRGYKGMVAMTSGNYGAAVAAQARMAGLGCIVVQEVFDSMGIGQPEILEKGRKCEAYGAEVWQLSVGPELFYVSLVLLEESRYFNASLYTPFSVSGIETLGFEIGEEVIKKYGKPPAAVLVTHAGGGNITGTARGLIKAGCSETQIIGVSVDLSGLHMASDHDFNRKSFTTGHTGFSVPFTVNPDRVDVSRNAARPLRYMDRFVSVTQGEVFYVTEALVQLEGLERGPAGNTSLAAAVAIAKEYPEDAIIVVQETEYTGAGKHPTAQLTFAKQMGIEVSRGNPLESIPGKSIIIPQHPSQIGIKDLEMKSLKMRYLNTVLGNAGIKSYDELKVDEEVYLANEVRVNPGGLPELVKGSLN